MHSIDGKKIALDIKESLRGNLQGEKERPRLLLVVVGSDPVTEKFIRAKETFAQEIGEEVETIRFETSVTEEELLRSLEGEYKKNIHGVVVQLPLPAHVNALRILNSIPVHLDVDVLSDDALGSFKNGNIDIFPPVAGAVKEICAREGIVVSGKKAVVVGKGRLVGLPVSYLLEREGAHVSVLDRGTKDISLFTKDADIVVSGAGSPNLITKDMIKDGVVLIDAATSEVEGVTKGDIDPLCKEKASVFTPVPGGVGPITVAILFRNLFENFKKR